MPDPIQLNPNKNIAPGSVTGSHRPTQQSTGSSFADALSQANGVKFSNHAQQRLQSRSIDMQPESLTRLATAVDKAQAKGAKESLILMDNLGFIVNIRDRTVVTTLDMNQRKQGVFTRIDSVVFADTNHQDNGNA
jgi:flagellar operon protein